MGDLMPPVYCPSCKRIIPAEADYCPYCGAAASVKARREEAMGTRKQFLTRPRASAIAAKSEALPRPEEQQQEAVAEARTLQETYNLREGAQAHAEEARRGEARSQETQNTRFSNPVTYLGGHPHYVEKVSGTLVANDSGLVFDSSEINPNLPFTLVVHERLVHFVIPYEQIIDVSSAGLAVWGGPWWTYLVGIINFLSAVIERKGNILVVEFFDEEGGKQAAKFHVHGPLTFAGEAERCQELLNTLAPMRPRFRSSQQQRPDQQAPASPAHRLSQLEELLERGLISREEYERKKSDILSEI